MAFNLTISVSNEDKAYLDNTKESPSKLFRKALEYEKTGIIKGDEQFQEKIDNLNKIITATQTENQRLYDELKGLRVLVNKI